MPALPRLLAAAAAALLLACGERGALAPPAPAPPDSARPPEGGQGAAREERPLVEPRRGDRHARAQARRTPRVRQLAGTIVRADARRLVIRPEGGPIVTLRLGPRTALSVQGRRAGPEVLRPGAEVRTSYRSGEGGPATAVTVEVTERAPGGAAPRQPEEQPASDRG